MQFVAVKKSRFVKEQEAKGLLSKLTGIKVSVLNYSSIENILLKKHKINAIVSKIILLSGDTFMPEIRLEEHGFTYSTCETFTENKKRIKKFKETGTSSYVYQTKLDKACF